MNAHNSFCTISDSRFRLEYTRSTLYNSCVCSDLFATHYTPSPSISFCNTLTAQHVLKHLKTIRVHHTIRECDTQLNIVDRSVQLCSSFISHELFSAFSTSAFFEWIQFWARSKSKKKKIKYIIFNPKN